MIYTCEEMMIQFVRSLNLSYYNIRSVRAFFIDNDGPTSWFVAAQLIDGTTTVRLVDGFTAQATAQAALDSLVGIIGNVAVI